MSFILVLDVIALCKYISFLSSMFNSIGNSPISPSSAGFGVEIGKFNITKFHIHIKVLVILLFDIVLFMLLFLFVKVFHF